MFSALTFSFKTISVHKRFRYFEAQKYFLQNTLCEFVRSSFTESETQLEKYFMFIKVPHDAFNGFDGHVALHNF